MNLRSSLCYFLGTIALAIITISPVACQAEDLSEGSAAPLFVLKNQEGKDFDLSSRRNAGWTVLYFYPKAETPGCTKQACAFRDAIQKIRVLGAEVYGISADSVEDQKKFHDNHKLTFDLLADSEMKVIDLYGSKMPLISLSKRWTFILDPQLTIRKIDHDVDPMLDAQHVADELKKLQSQEVTQP